MPPSKHFRAVMSLLSSEARNTTALAISGGPSCRAHTGGQHLPALLARSCGSHQVMQAGRVDGAWAHGVDANAARCKSWSRSARTHALRLWWRYNTLFVGNPFLATMDAFR